MDFHSLRKSNILLFTGMLMLVAGLPVSLFLTSLSQFFIAGSFFIEGSFRSKFKRFTENRLAVLIVFIWILHLCGLAWTGDITEGLKDLRIKLPLLILPVVLAGSQPLSAKQFRIVLATFILSVFAGSLISVAVYAGLIHRELHTIRDIFIFNVSHIRFALFVCLSVFILGTLIVEYIKNKKSYYAIALLVLAGWFVFFLFFIESMTGIVILMAATTIHLFIQAFRVSGKWTRIFLFLCAIIIPLMIGMEVLNVMGEYMHKPDYSINKNEKTSQGNTYIFLDDHPLYENGYPIWVYVCEPELRPAWNSLSSIPYDSLDKRGQPLRFTLIRFLASKGLKKDADGLNSLSEEEIKSIENGIANFRYQHLSNARQRLIQIIWEFDQYRTGANPSGHSVTQRIEFWKAAAGIIGLHPWCGVGTGDMPAAYREQYIRMNSQLTEHYRLRAHNQYLALAVALGIPVMLYFGGTLIFSLYFRRLWRNTLFLSFWMIATFSMFTEDTLETQSGATFFAFFICLFAFSQPGTEKNPEKNIQ